MPVDEQQGHLEPLDAFRGARLAIAHEWVAARAGSEKVFEALSQLFPDADLYALTLSPGVNLDVGKRLIRTTWLDRTPWLREHREVSLPLMPAAWKSLRGTYDIVITSAHAFARAFPPARNALHLSYVHTPARYLWTPAIDGRHPPRWAKPLVERLKQFDLTTVQTTDRFAANSTEVRDRIRSFYDRDSRVIPPPVDTDRFRRGAGSSSRAGLLCFGRWIDYKRFDIAIRAAALADEPLTVAGRGPLAPELKNLATTVHAPVTFVESPADGQVVELMASHRALVFPGQEDFGIVPVEAAAAGLPTIAFAQGGALDTVIDRVTGLHVPTQDPKDWAEVLAASRDVAWSTESLARHALYFSSGAFRSRILEWVTASCEK